MQSERAHPPPLPAIVVVDGDPSAEDLVKTLSREGFLASWTRSGADARRLASAPPGTRPALVVLELMLPDVDGIALCRQLAGSGVRVVVHSATRRRGDPALALQAGVEDYVPKSSGHLELLVRIRRLLGPRLPHRPQSAPPAIPPTAEEGRWPRDLGFDHRRHRVTFGERSVPLSRSDFALLTLLAAQVECPVSTELIAAELWPDADLGDPALKSLVPGYVYHLRRRLHGAGLPLVVQNVRGFGYALMPSPS